MADSTRDTARRGRYLLFAKSKKCSKRAPVKLCVCYFVGFDFLFLQYLSLKNVKFRQICWAKATSTNLNY